MAALTDNDMQFHKLHVGTCMLVYVRMYVYICVVCIRACVYTCIRYCVSVSVSVVCVSVMTACICVGSHIRTCMHTGGEDCFVPWQSAHYYAFDNAKCSDSGQITAALLAENVM